jgi:4'-phosphopantetheinyl transferase
MMIFEPNIADLPTELTGITQIVCVSLDALPSQHDYLAQSEQQRASKMPIAKYRQRFINSRGYLRQLLGHHLGHAPNTVDLAKQEKGKLYVPGSRLQFNLAHSKDMAVYAFNFDTPIGIDIEAKRPLDDLHAIARRVFSEQELAYLAAKTTESEQDKFFQLWARKEAVIKTTGEGLGAGLLDITTTLADGSINPGFMYKLNKSQQLIDLVKLKGFAGAIVCATPTFA